jgi:hypothetical protein
MLAAIVVPGREPLLFGSGSLNRQTTLHFLDEPLDADLPLSLLNYLSNAHELREQTLDSDDHQP